jgi:CCR4-NOT transcription complex subunit 6
VLQKELEEAQADVVCLQEVQTDHYEQDINPLMQEMGYDGIFKQKSRESMGHYGKVDGCATFWKKNKFIMTENYTIEFNECARRAASDMGLDESEYRRYMNRLSRDNIAQIVVLDTMARSRQSSLLCVANTHLYSNHTCPDVKLWQTMTLMRELDRFVLTRDVSLILCGDFNSEPESAVYEVCTLPYLASTLPYLQFHLISYHLYHLISCHLIPHPHTSTTHSTWSKVP